MAVEFKTSKTKENLMKAFAGESQARNRYTFAAEKAREQKMVSISEIFSFTAEQERAHGERFYELLKPVEGSSIEICGSFPVDPSTLLTELLSAAQHNEMQEFENIYPSFGDVAKEEGFLEIASAFYQIAEIEQIHGNRFGQLNQMLETNTYYERKEEGTWMCLNCGHIHRGRRVPVCCPVCRYAQGYFIPIELAPFTDAAILK